MKWVDELLEKEKKTHINYIMLFNHLNSLYYWPAQIALKEIKKQES